MLKLNSIKPLKVVIKGILTEIPGNAIEHELNTKGYPENQKHICSHGFNRYIKAIQVNMT